MNIIKGNNTVYIQPSEWVTKLWGNNNICYGIKQKSLPFGVDTDKFKNIMPIEERNKVFVYYKSRDPNLLNIIDSLLKSNNIDYKLFSYNNRYDENIYIEYLKHSKYGIWIGCHESQGFALEEALSSNVPLFVWNVKSMNEEYMSNYADIAATSIPYWDEQCGEHFYNLDELVSKFSLFLSKLYTYKPREYILEKLSMEKCEQQFINLIDEM